VHNELFQCLFVDIILLSMFFAVADVLFQFVQTLLYSETVGGQFVGGLL
jgi:hypothetical protein